MNIVESLGARLPGGDPTLEDDVEAGRIKADPTVFVEQSEEFQDDDYDFESAEFKHYEELAAILYEAEKKFVENYSEPEEGAEE